MSEQVNVAVENRSCMMPTLSFNLMGLSGEVPNLIYEHALVRGKIFVPSVISKNLNDVGPDLNLVGVRRSQ